MQIKRLGKLTAALAGIALAGSVQAATISLDDEIYASFTPNGIIVDNADVFEETAAGVTFTFANPDNFVGGAGFNVGSDGLHVGGGGGSVIEFTLMVSHDVELTSYTANDSGGFELGAATFDILEGAVTISSPNSLVGDDVDEMFANDPVLQAGVLYTVDINNIGAGVQSYLTSISFEPVVIPVPAAAPLLLSALGVLGFVRRRGRITS